jgi:hypothetical protein
MAKGENKDRDYSLDVLLDMDGQSHQLEDKYWFKVEAWEVPVTKERPHGIRYNLTLHNQYNKRVMGFDNAHGIKSPKKHQGRIVEYDHIHKKPCDKGTPYSFETASQLLTDFFERMNQIIKENQ